MNSLQRAREKSERDTVHHRGTEVTEKSEIKEGGGLFWFLTTNQNNPPALCRIAAQGLDI
jgi:hypothetical protein